MAKIDWQKHNYQQKNWKASTPSLRGGSTYIFYRENNLWTLPGKYYGTHLHNLPTDYLKWVKAKFKKSTLAYSQARDELVRRIQQSNTNT